MLDTGKPPAGQESARALSEIFDLPLSVPVQRSELGNPDDAVAFLRWFDPNGRHCLAAAEPEGQWEYHLFEPGTWDEMRTWIVDRLPHKNIYYTPNEVRAGTRLDPGPKEADIGCIRAVYVDFDPDKSKPLESERKRIRILISEEFEGCYSAFVDSGGGYQIIQKLDQRLAATDYGQAAANQGRAFAEKFGGDTSIYNFNRVLRLPGTINHPNAAKRKAGRGKAQARAEDILDQSFSLLELAELVPPLKMAPRKQMDQTPLVPWEDADSPTGERYRTWLKEIAPEAIEGARGDDVTVKTVATRGKDFGLHREATEEILLEWWNEHKAIPPWEPVTLGQKVDNAYNHCHENSPGCLHPLAEFGDFLIKDERPWPAPTPLRDRDPRDIPKRQEIVPGLLVRGFVSGLVAPGGTGKTQLIVNACLAIASGSEKLLGCKIVERTRAWYWNQEDDRDELDRRFTAARQCHGVTPADICIDGERAVFVDSGVDRPLMLAGRKRNGSLAPNKKVIDSVIAQIKARGIGAFIFDPLAEFHEADENKNGEMRTVAAIARRIAVEGNCAVLMVAHTRKPPKAQSEGFAGDIDSIRGAAAQINVMRLGLTLYPMSPEDAKQLGVPPAERRRYVRLDLAKSNLSRLSDEPRWFRWVSVLIGDLEEGEQIGVLEPAVLTKKISEADVLGILAKTIASGAGGLQRAQSYTLKKIAELMEAHEKAFFPDNNHRADALNRALNSPGVTDDGQRAHAPTSYGTLTVRKTKGRGGIQISLGAPEQAEGNGHD